MMVPVGPPRTLLEFDAGYGAVPKLCNVPPVPVGPADGRLIFVRANGADVDNGATPDAVTPVPQVVELFVPRKDTDVAAVPGALAPVPIVLTVGPEVAVALVTGKGAVPLRAWVSERVSPAETVEFDAIAVVVETAAVRLEPETGELTLLAVGLRIHEEFDGAYEKDDTVPGAVPGALPVGHALVVFEAGKGGSELAGADDVLTETGPSVGDAAQGPLISPPVHTVVGVDVPVGPAVGPAGPELLLVIGYGVDWLGRAVCDTTHGPLISPPVHNGVLEPNVGPVGPAVGPPVLLLELVRGDGEGEDNDSVSEDEAIAEQGQTIVPAVHIDSVGVTAEVGSEPDATQGPTMVPFVQIGAVVGRAPLATEPGAVELVNGADEVGLVRQGPFIEPPVQIGTVAGLPVGPTVRTVKFAGNGADDANGDVAGGKQVPFIEPAGQMEEVVGPVPVGPRGGVVEFAGNGAEVDKGMLDDGLARQGPLMDPPEH